MILQKYVNSAKIILIIAVIAVAVWLYKDWEFQKSENKRQTENVSQLRKEDSLHFASQILTTNELKEYLQYQNTDLKNKLLQAGIKENRVTEVIKTNYIYKDSAKKETDISSLIDAVKNAIPKSQSWTDSTKCQTIKGTVAFDGQKLKVIVSDREFKNESNAVAYWERRQWKFLGIKTRLLGKKQFTAKVFDNCGESKVLKIQKKE